MNLALPVLLFALGSQPSGSQARDPRATIRGTAAISGVVVSDDGEARPVRKARVTCGSPDASGRTTITDDGGRFVFDGLPAGRYTVTASKPAWVTIAYGAKRPQRPGSAIPLGDGQTVAIVVRMPRGAVVTGVVFDQNNEPAANASVRAMRYAMANGERRLVPAGSTTTDDRGAYRIFGLVAGDYVVGGVGRPATGSAELRLTTDADVRHATTVSPQSPAPPDRGVALAMTYFPGSTIASQAGVVSLRPGEERGGVDFALQLVPTARVEGTVSLPEGGAPPGTEVTLSALRTIVSGQAFEGFRTVHTAPDGSFAFAGVSPGEYTVLARAARPIANADGTSGAPPQLVWASTDLVIDGEPIVGLGLSLEPGLSLAGQIRFEAAALRPPADLSAIRVRAAPAMVQGSVSFAPGPASVKPDGRFTIDGLTPGRYRLSVSFPGLGRPGGWLLKSATANGTDALDQAFSVQPNEHVMDAAIVFADRLGQLSGTLRTAAGAALSDYTVVIFPANPSLWTPQSRRLQGARPSADGVYTIRNLPAGDYLIAAADDVEPGEWFDSAFLQRLSPSATKIAIADGEHKTQDIRIGGS
ncbi:MAG TPA: carboxypeptidase-like regulatory domain-containing protein [Vicinamibacterales bacterium]|nr:carboxypeptidase-like regulatory domain-containing protein [Vicinamibacterales bacterium]